MSNYDDIINNTEQVNQDFDKDAWAENKKNERNMAYALADSTAEQVIQNDEKFKSYLDVQARFYRYSATNALLIYAKNKHARKIGDRNYWRNMGVYIKEKEFKNPITIIEAAGTYERPDGSIGVSYNAKKVYDISQTTARPEAQAAINIDERLLLKTLLSCSPVSTKVTDQLPSNVNAYYDQEQKIIWVRQGLEAQSIFKHVSKEIALAQLAVQDDGVITQKTDFKAYSVSYLLCREFGVNTQGYQFNQFPNSFSDMEPQDIRENLSDINKTSLGISTKIANSLKQNKELKNKEQER